MNTTYIIYKQDGTILTKYANANAIQNSVAVFNIKFAFENDEAFDNATLIFRRSNDTIVELEAVATSFEFEGKTYNNGFSVITNSALNVSGLAYFSVACFKDNTLVLTSVETTYRVEKSNYFEIKTGSSLIILLGVTSMSFEDLANAYASNDNQYFYFTKDSVNYLLNQAFTSVSTKEQEIINLSTYEVLKRSYNLDTGVGSAFTSTTYYSTTEVDEIITSLTNKIIKKIFVSHTTTLREIYNQVGKNTYFLIVPIDLATQIFGGNNIYLGYLYNPVGNNYSLSVSTIDNYLYKQSASTNTLDITIQSLSFTKTYYTIDRTSFTSNNDIVNKKYVDDTKLSMSSTYEHFKYLELNINDDYAGKFNAISNAINNKLGTYFVYDTSDDTTKLLLVSYIDTSVIIAYTIDLDGGKTYWLEFRDNDTTTWNDWKFNPVVASNNNVGGIRLGYTNVSSDYRPVQIDSNNKAYVYVPAGAINVASSLTLGGVQAYAVNDDTREIDYDEEVRIDTNNMLYAKSLYEHTLSIHYTGNEENYFSFSVLNYKNSSTFSTNQSVVTANDLYNYIYKNGCHYQASGVTLSRVNASGTYNGKQIFELYVVSGNTTNVYIRCADGTFYTNLANYTHYVSEYVKKINYQN